MVTRTVRGTVVFVIAAGLFILSQNIAAAGQAADAKNVAEHMDKGKYSSSEIKSYLKELKGNTVTADGKVNDIMTGKTGNRVVVYVNVPSRGKDFVVDVYVDDASKLHKGDHVSCKGNYVKYNMFTVNGITLKDGSCTKK